MTEAVERKKKKSNRPHCLSVRKSSLHSSATHDQRHPPPPQRLCVCGVDRLWDQGMASPGRPQTKHKRFTNVSYGRLCLKTLPTLWNSYRQERKQNKPKKNRSQNKKRNKHTESWKEKNLAQLEKKTICFYFWASGQKTRKRQKILTYSSWKTTHSKPEVSVRSTLICCTHVNKWIRAHGWCKICAWWKHFHSLTPQPEWTALICCTHAWPCVIIIITMNNGRWMVQDLCPMKTFPQPSA